MIDEDRRTARAALLGAMAATIEKVDAEIAELMLKLETHEGEDIMPTMEAVIDLACSVNYAEKNRTV